MDKFWQTTQDVSCKLWKLYLTHIPSHPTTRSLWWLPLHMCPLFLNHQFCRYLQSGLPKIPKIPLLCSRPHYRLPFSPKAQSPRVSRQSRGHRDLIWCPSLVGALPSPLQDAIHGAPYKVSLLQGQNSFVIFGSKKFGYSFTFKRILNALIFLFLSCGHEKLFFSSLERLTSWMHERLATADYRTLFSKFFPCYPAMAKVNASAQNLLSKYHVVLRSHVQTARFVQRSQLQNVEIYNYRVILLTCPPPLFRTKITQ